MVPVMICLVMAERILQSLFHTNQQATSLQGSLGPSQGELIDSEIQQLIQKYNSTLLL